MLFPDFVHYLEYITSLKTKKTIEHSIRVQNCKFYSSKVLNRFALTSQNTTARSCGRIDFSTSNKISFRSSSFLQLIIRCLTLILSKSALFVLKMCFASNRFDMSNNSLLTELVADKYFAEEHRRILFDTAVNGIVKSASLIISFHLMRTEVLNRK